MTVIFFSGKTYLINNFLIFRSYPVFVRNYRLGVCNSWSVDCKATEETRNNSTLDDKCIEAIQHVSI